MPGPFSRDLEHGYVPKDFIKLLAPASPRCQPLPAVFSPSRQNQTPASRKALHSTSKVLFNSTPSVVVARSDSPASKFVITHSFVAEGDGEMSVHPGQVVTVAKGETATVRPPGGWVLVWAEAASGEGRKLGYIPESFIKPVVPPSPKRPRSLDQTETPISSRLSVIEQDTSAAIRAVTEMVKLHPPPTERRSSSVPSSRRRPPPQPPAEFGPANVSQAPSVVVPDDVSQASAQTRGIEESLRRDGWLPSKQVVSSLTRRGAEQAVPVLKPLSADDLLQQTRVIAQRERATGEARTRMQRYMPKDGGRPMRRMRSRSVEPRPAAMAAMEAVRSVDGWKDSEGFSKMLQSAGLGLSLGSGLLSSNPVSAKFETRLGASEARKYLAKPSQPPSAFTDTARRPPMNPPLSSSTARSSAPVVHRRRAEAVRANNVWS
jgi:hypothetical protein